MLMMDAGRSLLLVVDVQARLVPAVHEGEAVVEACAWMVRVARDLEVPVRYCEEYPQGLGSTVAPLAGLLAAEERLEKLAFGIAAEPDCRDALAALGREQMVLCGMEAHVCLLQSALGLRELGYQVFVVEDAIGARHPESKRIAVQRLLQAGVSLVNREMVLFEWLERAGTPRFRELRQHLRSPADRADTGH